MFCSHTSSLLLSSLSSRAVRCVGFDPFVDEKWPEPRGTLRDWHPLIPGGFSLWSGGHWPAEAWLSSRGPGITLAFGSKESVCRGASGPGLAEVCGTWPGARLLCPGGTAFVAEACLPDPWQMGALGLCLRPPRGPAGSKAQQLLVLPAGRVPGEHVRSGWGWSLPPSPPARMCASPDFCDVCSSPQLALRTQTEPVRSA